MGNVVVLTTGGTISSMQNKTTGLLRTGSINGKDLVDACEIGDGIQVQVEEIFRIPSNQYTFHELMILKEKVESILEQEEVDGVVITHGTDTLEETAYFLNLVIRQEKPIVITGSQRSLGNLGSDVQMNLKQAVQVASDRKSRDLGVLVLFNEEIFTANEVRKFHASNIAGFACGEIGTVDGADVIYSRKPFLRTAYSLQSPLSPVDLISCSLGSDDKFLECSIRSGVEGIVLDGFGRGHVPPVLVPKIKEAADKGIVIVVTSRTLEGRVYPVYDFPGGAQDLMNQGVILGGSLSAYQARIKLAVLLSVFQHDKGRIKQEFNDLA
ncbi:asparaginase [Ferviditalea candida]|uniref:asparaginase n=1 Tax=Ferviditalea candida TaxID=3108399 RepID=A0ABU5ZHT7_9BACL|nr:asparaginase [Paenibacillaceae bacterium T2]